MIVSKYMDTVPVTSQGATRRAEEQNEDGAALQKHDNNVCQSDCMPDSSHNDITHTKMPSDSSYKRE